MKRSSAVSTGTSTTARRACHEQLGLGGLLAVLAAKRQRHPDDDALRLVLGDEAGDLGEARPRSRPCATTHTGRASVPLASETATPVRAEP